MQPRTDNKRVLFVINPVSGGGRVLDIVKGVFDQVPTVRAFEAQTGFKLELEDHLMLHTTKGGEWKREVSRIIEDASERIGAVMVFGGDGTLAETVALLHASKSKPVFVPIPGGRGNDFVRGLNGYSVEDGIFWDWAEKHGKWNEKNLDLASVNDQVFLNMASIGYGGRVVEAAHERDAFWSKTPLVYQVEGALAFLTSDAKLAGVRAVVKVDDKVILEGDFFGAFVGNGKANGSGLFWTRHAHIDDGRIDVLAFAKPSLYKMIFSLNAVKRRAAPTFVHAMGAGKRIQFEFNKAVALELDGEFRGNASKYGFSCLPDALKCIIIS
jgi:diacylglycerol kinase family enzyme